MSMVSEMIGKTYGRLTVLAQAETVNVLKRISCLCACGNRVEVTGSEVKRGRTQSCGCLHKERASAQKLEHGMVGTLIYKVWCGMLERTTREGHAGYGLYGGRGITVSEDWKEFKNFYRDMGDKPFHGAQLDRKDNNKGYSKENCQWSTRSQNGRNKRNNVFVEFRGERRLMIELAEEYKLKFSVVRDRIKHGWDVDRAVTQRIKERHNTK